MILTATQQHLDTILAARYDATAREIERKGIRLTHDEADELGDVGMDWLRTRLSLAIQTTDRGVDARATERGGNTSHAALRVIVSGGDPTPESEGGCS